MALDQKLIAAKQYLAERNLNPITVAQRRTPPVRTAARGFEAAAINRLTQSWVSSVQAIDQELRGDLDRMRARSREMRRNNEYAKKFIRAVRNNIVGPVGFTLQCTVTDGPDRPDALANNAIEWAFYEWSQRGACEITGRMSFVGLCQAVAMGAATDGEFLVRRVIGPAASNAWGYALQYIDVARLATNLNRAPGNGQNAIIMGVEVDAYSRPVAYHLRPLGHQNGVPTRADYEVIPASDILHGFLCEEAEQTRGIPWMHAAMRRLHDLGGYREAAIIAARIGASKMGFYEIPDGDPGTLADGTDADGVPYTEVDAGQFGVLPPGYKFTTFDPTYPHDQFDAFNKACLRGISSGFGVAYHSLASDLEGVNFSSSRAGTLEERDEWMVLQGWFVDTFLRPVFLDWLNVSLLAGVIKNPNGSALPVTKADKFRAHSWQGRRWSWVDPFKDLQATALAMDRYLKSPQQVASEMGVDIEDVLDQVKRFQDMLKAKGLKANPAAATKPAADAGKDDEETADETDDETATSSP